MKKITLRRMESLGQKGSHTLSNAKREIDRDDTLAINLRGLPIDPWPVAKADSPRSNDLDRWLTTATQDAEESWAELIKVENTTTRVGVVSLLLLGTLIGFAILCWAAIGWVCESILMPN
jgi:hypothetical protein